MELKLQMLVKEISLSFYGGTPRVPITWRSELRGIFRTEFFTHGVTIIFIFLCLGRKHERRKEENDMKIDVYKEEENVCTLGETGLPSSGNKT